MNVSDKFARVVMTADLSKIRREDRAVLKRLILAAKSLNTVYLRQVSHLNLQFKQEIEDSQNKKLIENFEIMGCPWDRLNDEKPYYGTYEKPLGAGFYPFDMTKETFENWLSAHPEDEAAFTSSNTIIRKEGDGFVAWPYSKAYKFELNQAATYLREAASLTSSVSLRRFLNLRADSLMSNDYQASDAAWIGLNDTRIEVVFGPYETYEDRLFGYKAAFECFIGYQNEEETARLAHLTDLCDTFQSILPIDEELKATRRGNDPSPFRVIDLLATAGEARYGVQTLAFVLPNDPDVIKLHGTKKVMMKNVQEAKFNEILLPIARHFLAPDAISDVSFDAFFRHTIMHETSHSLGPKAVRNSDRAIQIHLADTYAPLEECKADSTANYLIHWLFERGDVTEKQLRSTYATMVAGFFRSLRFGLTQAHARANAIQLNFLLEKGAVILEKGRYNVCFDKMHAAITELVRRVMELEYEGDREAAMTFMAQYAVLSPELSKRLEVDLAHVPVDIAPRYGAEKPDFFEEKLV